MKEFDDDLRVVRGARVLAMDPEVWAVPLRDGNTIEVLAHGRYREGEIYVFELLFQGSPDLRVPVLKLPASLLLDEGD